MNNTQELREFVWSKISDRLKSRGIDLYDLKLATQEQFTTYYYEAWDIYVKELGI